MSSSTLANFAAALCPDDNDEAHITYTMRDQMGGNVDGIRAGQIVDMD